VTLEEGTALWRDLASPASSNAAPLGSRATRLVSAAGRLGRALGVPPGPGLDGAAARQSTGYFAALSAQEREVLGLVAAGCRDRVIADALGISRCTVSSHLTNILNKLGVDNRTAAAAEAIRRGLI
jgi:DNA-binding NarL/FixJ family response regulator